MFLNWQINFLDNISFNSTQNLDSKRYMALLISPRKSSVSSNKTIFHYISLLDIFLVLITRSLRLDQLRNSVNTLHKFKCPVFLYPVQFIVEGSLRMRRNLWSSMQKCKPFSHWPGQGCQQCSVYSGVYTCTSPAGPVSYAWSLTQWRREQLRSQPTPSVASGIDQATGAGVKLWWKCEEILALWSLQVKTLRRNHTVVLYNFVIVRFLPLVTINFEVSIRQWRVRVNEKTMNHNETLFTCRQWHDISYHSFEEEVINIKTKWAAAAQSLKDFERIQYLGMNCGRIPTSPPASPACFIIRNRRSISSGKGQRWVNMHIL